MLCSGTPKEKGALSAVKQWLCKRMGRCCVVPAELAGHSVLIHATFCMNNKSNSTVHESSSNQHCLSLISWIKENGREPDPKATAPTEQFLGKFLERKRSKRAKPYQSDENLLIEHGFPNLFDKADYATQQVNYAREVCAALRANGGKIPSKTDTDPSMSRMGNWIRNRRAAAHGVLHLNIPPGVIEVFREANLLHVLHIPDVTK